VRISDKVRYVNAEGLGVVLDLRTARYLVLDDRATLLFEHLTAGRSVDAPADVILRFANRCRDLGWLYDAEHERTLSSRSYRPAKPTRGPAFIEAVISLLWAKRALADGFASAYERLPTEQRRIGATSIEQLLRAFLRAETLVTFDSQPDDCLPRSIALYRLLVRRGLHVRHIIGVRRVPFAAHAWVEYEGRPLLDHRVKGFLPLSVVEPW
jgi:hypothetical protein